VLITRARRDAGGPQVPSRLWLRLCAQYERDGAPPLPRRDELIAIARAVDAASGLPRAARRPLPNPPLALRPKRISITEIDTLITDPFAFHARHILKLRPLDPLDQDPTPAMRGELAHKVMEAWVKGRHGSEDQLRRIMAEVLKQATSHFPLLEAAWVPRIERALLWAGRQVLDDEAEGWRDMIAEVDGRMTLPGGVELRGRIDRLDRHDDGRLRVVDYKTGAPPGGTRVRALEANQLALGLAMAAGGKLTRDGKPVAAGPPGSIEYWQLKGGRREAGKRSNPLGRQVAAGDHIALALEKAVTLVEHYLLAENPFRPKLRSQWAWGDYDHLARVAEWINRGDRA
jgi:ATP-dependent helicase/nuclease subunit B